MALSISSMVISQSFVSQRHQFKVLVIVSNQNTFVNIICHNNYCLYIIVVLNVKHALFAVDKTQVPCLLTMDIINNAKANMTEKDFKSYRAYVEDVLNGWRPPVKFDVIEGGKK
jgi:hypothetical protein